MAVRKGNKLVSISVPAEKVHELKLKALKNRMTLSDFMTMTASEYNPSKVTESKPIK